MTEAENADRRAVAALQSQIDRLTSAACCLRDARAEANALAADSELGARIADLRRAVGEQRSIVNGLEVTGFLRELNAILRENRRQADVDRMACERAALVGELQELDAAILRAVRDHGDVTERLRTVCKEAAVLGDLLSSAVRDGQQPDDNA